jgi:isoquinoline 1-oxidoreductase beta subunit
VTCVDAPDPGSASERDFILSRRALLRLGGAAAIAGAWLSPAGAEAAAAETAAWLSIEPSGEVVFTCGAAEIGQGAVSALAQIVADEMDADWAKMRYRIAGAGAAYDNPGKKLQAVGRSMSVRGYHDLLRRIGATARARLLAAAAQKWNAPAAEIEVADGRLLHRASGRTLGFGDVAEAAARGPMPAAVTLKPASARRLVGQSVLRLDLPEKVDGSAIYASDVRLPGMLNAAIAMAPSFGGALARFDEAAARASPGVRAVVQTKSGLAHGLAIVADTWWQARPGLEAAAPEWEAGPNAAVTSESLAAERRAALSGPGLEAFRTGNPDAVFATAGKTISASYAAPYLAHVTMEPMSALARVENGRCEIWAAPQGQQRARDAAARLLKISPADVVVHSTLAGGGFGRRWQVDFIEQAVEIAAAVKRPVKLLWSREEDTSHDYYRPATDMSFRARLGADGLPTALEIKVAGSSISSFGRPDRAGEVDRLMASGLSDSPYHIANYRVACAATSSPIPVGVWRSVGHSQNVFFLEAIIDELAAAARIDPIVFRKRMLADHPRYIETLDRVAALSGWSRKPPRGVGRGVALAEAYGSIVAQVVEVSVKADKIKIHRICAVISCGRAVTPDGVKAQMEGAIVYGLAAALTGDAPVDAGGVTIRNFHDAPALTLAQTPPIVVDILESDDPLGGAGEPGLPPLAPALVNAIHAATGKRIRSLPLSGHDLWLA